MLWIIYILTYFILLDISKIHQTKYILIKNYKLTQNYLLLKLPAKLSQVFFTTSFILSIKKHFNLNIIYKAFEL